MYPESLSEGDIPPKEPSFSPRVFDVTSDDYSISDGDSYVTKKTGPSHQSRTSLQAEGVTPAEHPVTAGTSQRGQVRTMSRKMAESIAQGLHHVAHESITGETDEDLSHDSHLELQERMRNPIAFHAKMMGDIMYATHQAAKYSPDPRQSHGEAILYLVRYLKKTRDIGLKFTPDPTKGFKC
jgi:hypothetical protein